TILTAGLPFPKLEDEVAYSVQALVFESGNLKGHLLSGWTGDWLRDVAPLPFVLLEDSGRYYSTHMHGWSWVLAAFSLVGLKPLANAILAIVNLWVFSRVARYFFGPDESSVRYLVIV